MNLNSISIEEEFRRNSTLKKTDIEEFKKYCSEKFYPSSESDSDSALFLHSSYFYLESAKSNVERYYTTRESLPSFFQQLSNENLTKISDQIAIVPLSKRTREGYKVILARPLSNNQKDINATDAIKLLNMVLEVNIHEEGTLPGYILVVDVYGNNVFERDSVDSSAVKKYFNYLRTSAPIRWFGLHFVNTLLPFERIEPFTRMTIVQNEYVDAMNFHSDLESLNEVVQLEVLPDEMTGKAGPLKDLQAAQITKLRDRSWWFTRKYSNETFASCLRNLKVSMSTLSTTTPSLEQKIVSPTS